MNASVSISKTPWEELQEANDDEIVNRVRQGETRGYELLIRRHNQRLYRVIRGILGDRSAVEDAMQEAYIAAYQSLDHYNARGQFAAWLTRIAINEALMTKRKHRRWREVGIERIEERIENDNETVKGPSHKLANQQLARLIEAGIDRLPPDFRLVFILRGLQQLSLEETSSTLGIPIATVKTRYYRARALMQRSLEPHLRNAQALAFEFAGARCDSMVQRVMYALKIDLKNL